MNVRSTLLKGGQWTAAACSGVLLAASFPPWNQHQLVWIALLPLLGALWTLPSSASRWKAPLLGYAAGIVYFTATFYWLHALADIFDSPFLRGVPLLLAVYLSSYPALWAWLVATPPDAAATPAVTSLRNVRFAACGAAAWVALEWVRGWLFTGFGWNSPGVALHNNLALIQIADLFGVYGITFIVLFANLTFALILRRIKHDTSIRLLPNLRGEIMTLLVLVGITVSYGVRVVLEKPTGGFTQLRAVCLQPNIPQLEKFAAEQEASILSRLERLMEVATALNSPKPDLILWPEATTPRGMFADELNHSFTMEQAKRAAVPLLIGSVEPAVAPWDSTQVAEYNSAILIGDRAVELQSYRKRHLVPFGEFLPFRQWAPGWLGDLVPGDLEPGTEANLLHLSSPRVRIGALVCFEDSLAAETRSLVRAGAQLLVNLTNDAWFGTTAAALQHLANAKFRAVETRLPLLRCANSGVSCQVDPLGRVEQHLEPFTEGVDTLSVQVPNAPALTPYMRWGDRWIGLCAALGLLLIRDKTRHTRVSYAPKVENRDEAQ
jgi:apolipoprotein N-acyltransferase